MSFYPYAEHGRLVPDVVPFDHGKDTDLPHVKFASVAFAIRRCERPFDRENAFGIVEQQHVHCHRKIHTQNACHTIPRGKTQKAF